MARQQIDTTTNNGTFIGDPAPTAFGKINAMTSEIYTWVSNNGNEVRFGSSGNGMARIAINAGNVYWDSYDTYAGNLPNANALYRAGNHRWTNGNGVTIGSLSSVGDLSISNTVSTQIVDVIGANASLRFIDRTDFSRKWAWYSSGAVARLFFDGVGDRLNVSYTGAVGAVSFNPTSSADVKDNIEGYVGDACAELDRLVVITYTYRPEFGGPEGVIAGLLAENVKTVYPNAVGGDYDETVLVPSEDLDDDGNPVLVEETHHVPMNIDIMQVLARTVRAHQQKNRRIKQLEGALAELLRRVEGLEVSR